MKKIFQTKPLLCLTLGAGIGAFLLQHMLFSEALSPMNLLDTSHPANSLGFWVAGIMLCVLCAGSLSCKNSWNYRHLFSKNIFAAIGCFLAAVGFLGTAFQVPSGSKAIIAAGSVVLGVGAAACMIYEGMYRLGLCKLKFNCHNVVAFYMVFHLIAQYNSWSGQTQAEKYIFPLVGEIFLMISTYYRACLFAEQKVEGRYRFFSFGALLLALPAMVRGDWMFFAAGAAWLATTLWAMPGFSPMYLPENVLFCIDALEERGFEAYAVGGCVRDALLGLTPNDYDLCTNATPKQTAKVFADHKLVRSGEKHGTIGVIFGKEVIEITTFRTEGGYTDSRHPDWVEFVSDVKEDLARRDFTVNAMAYSPTKGYIDPWGGQKDLKTRTLRAVGDAYTRFREDSLRILRGVRFSVTYQLTPEADTAAAMEELAPLMDTLARERVFVELSKLLPKITAEQLMRYAPVLSQAIPELAPMIGFDQCSPHHAYDVFTHTAYTVEKVGPQLPVRLAALLHDIGKPAAFTKDENGRGHFYDHAKVGATIAEQVLQQLKVPTELREQVVFLVEHHMTALEPDKKILRRRIGKFGQEAVLALLELQKADCASKGVPEETVSFRAVEQLLEQIQQEDACFSVKDLAIKGEDLIAMGFPAGPQMGKCLEFLLGQIQDEKIPNTREALLAAAKNYMEGLQ